jgi:hypothetical protein
MSSEDKYIFNLNSDLMAAINGVLEKYELKDQMISMTCTESFSICASVGEIPVITKTELLIPNE